MGLSKKYCIYVVVMAFCFIWTAYVYISSKRKNVPIKMRLHDKLTDVGVVLADIQNNPKFKNSFRRMISTMVDRSSVDINLHVIADADGRAFVNNILSETAANIAVHFFPYDISSLVVHFGDTLAGMKHHFSNPSSLGYYSRALFLISPLLYEVLNTSVSKIIILDTDLEFREDIGLLNKQFQHFNEAQMVGAAPELTPVYRHVLGQWRREHPDSLKGLPLPAGHPGFNNGVLLLHLQRMRSSSQYQALLRNETLTRAAQKYTFKGHLGSQDFYTLMNFEYPALFYTLECGWNRQLCTWWRDHGYADVFDNYFKCDQKVKIYHGNCDTPIPND